MDAQPDEERTYTDARLIERLQELERQSVEFQDEEGTWYYSLGCILGELSGQLLPMTAQDTALWEELERQFWAQASHQIQGTEPCLPALHEIEAI